MKVMLINPPPANNESYHNNIVYPPLGIAYIASFLRKNGHFVNIVDANALNYSLKRILKSVTEFDPDVVGMTASTNNLKDIDYLSKEIKGINKSIKIILGGPHISSDLEKITIGENIDFLIVGEGEISFSELVRCLKTGSSYESIKGLCYRKNNEIMTNNKASFIDDLDELPMPSYDLLPIEKYSSVQSSTKSVMTMVTSRGCPYMCTFCAVPKILGYKYRFFSAERVVAEMKYLKTQFMINEIHFKDSIFNLNIERISKICEIMIKTELGMSWLCNARVDGVTKEILDKMKKAGCISITYGIESGSPIILNRLKKGFKIETAINAIRMTKDSGIEVTANYIIGNPGDTAETIERTIDFAVKMDTDYANFNYLVPLPGTEIYEEAIRNKWFVMDYNTQDIRYDKCSINATDIPTEKLNQCLKIAYRRFYIRPSYIFRRLKKLNLHEMKKNYMGLKQILKA